MNVDPVRPVDCVTRFASTKHTLVGEREPQLCRSATSYTRTDLTSCTLMNMNGNDEA